jgi:hypothetical protein
MQLNRENRSRKGNASHGELSERFELSMKMEERVVLRMVLGASL